MKAVPQAVTAPCPDCGEPTLHRVLNGRMGTRGGLTLDATVQCEECERTHHVVLREAPDVEVAVVVSHGGQSRRTRVTLSGDDSLLVGDELLVDGGPVLVTGIELKNGLRREKGVAAEIGTLWVKDFESTRVRVGINLRAKTIVKEIQADPDRLFSLGQELVFGRLRVTVHGIKTKERMLKHGSAPAREIVKVFAKPTRGETLDTPAPLSEEELAAQGVRREQTAEDVEPEEGDAWDEVFEGEDTE